MKMIVETARIKKVIVRAPTPVEPTSSMVVHAVGARLCAASCWSTCHRIRLLKYTGIRAEHAQNPTNRASHTQIHSKIHIKTHVNILLAQPPAHYTLWFGYDQPPPAPPELLDEARTANKIHNRDPAVQITSQQNSLHFNAGSRSLNKDSTNRFCCSATSSNVHSTR